jgi:DNA-binding transcriptional MerR regulator
MDASIHTVRDYKKRGLIRIADKRGNKDLYSKVDIVRRHSVIDQKRREGYTLAQISKVVEGDFGKIS